MKEWCLNSTIGSKVGSTHCAVPLPWLGMPFGSMLCFLGNSFPLYQSKELHQLAWCHESSICCWCKHNYWFESWLKFYIFLIVWISGLKFSNVNLLLQIPQKHLAPLKYLRVTLVCFVLVAKQCYFILEHPAQTLLNRHKRWEDFCNSIAYATQLIARTSQDEGTGW